jgi:exopolysaccharide biosynthesis polyprenyl glycosylphosphotransferase
MNELSLNLTENVTPYQASHRMVRNMTILTDLLLINLAFAFAYVVRYLFELPVETLFRDPYSAYIGQQFLLTLLLTIIFAQNKVWRRRRGEFLVDELSRVGYATATGIALMMAITFFFRPLAFSRLLLVWALLFIVLFLGLARIVRRLILEECYRRDIGTDRVLVIGSGEAGRSVIRTMLARPGLGYKMVGYLDDSSGENNIGLGRVPHLGNYRDLDTILTGYPRLHTVFIALPARMHTEMNELLYICHQQGIYAKVVPDLFQLSLNRVEFENMAGIPMLSLRQVAMSRTGLFFKRLIDLGLAAILALPVGLVTMLIGLAIRLETPGPVFYRQQRVGKQGKPFWMVKFRSMVVDAEDRQAALEQMNEASGPIFKIRNDPRITRVGRIIRRLSLDELPQLWNIFRGDMSFVGPRPPLPQEVAEYEPWQMRRLEVIGGLTGLWQISGRSDLTFDEGCLLDIYYIENWSLALDFRLIIQTIPYLLSGRGAY